MSGARRPCHARRAAGGDVYLCERSAVLAAHLQHLIKVEMGGGQGGVMLRTAPLCGCLPQPKPARGGPYSIGRSCEDIGSPCR